MAYLALYRKWRPRTFTEVVGQKHISVPLMRAIEQDRLAHAYLFSGPRGTGKTSMAKILAKAVNCLHPDGANPCNQCQNCKEINEGSSMDVYEIDAASNRGIEEIRALKESVRTLPSTCRKKVYIIDEVHMLTKEAFNALLKTLEEPPSHVLFILATTEPEKIPLTILSRCQRYEFHRISAADIKEHLLYIAKESGIPLTEDAADLIAVRADGGLRDALSLLDQCSSASESDTLDAETVYNLLGLTSKDRIIELSHHIFNGKSGEALTLFYQILQDGKEPASILRDLLEHFRNLIICRINPKAPELSAYGKNIEKLRADAQKLSPAYLDGLFDDLHGALTETKRSSSPRMSAEMGLIHLCHIRGAKSLESLNERVAALERQVEALKKGAPVSGNPVPVTEAAPAVTVTQGFGGFTVQAEPPVPPVAPAFPDSVPEMPTAAPVPPRQNTRTVPHEPPAPQPQPASGNTSFGSSAATSSPQAAAHTAAVSQPTKPPENRNPKPETPPANPGSAPLINPVSYPQIWKQVLDYFMAIRRIDVFTCLKKSTLIYANEERAIVSAPQRFLVMAGNNPSYQKVTQEAFQKVTGHPIMAHTVLKGSDEEAEAFTLLKAGQAAPQPAAPSPSPAAPVSEKEKASVPPASQPVSTPAPQAAAPANPSDGYHPIEASQISEADRENPSLKEALKILPDCDIYEKF